MFLMKHKFIILFACLLLLDQVLKYYVNQTMEIGSSYALIPGVLWMTHIRNTGMAFGQFQGNNMLMIFVVIAILGLLIYWYDQFISKEEKLGYTLIMAGLFGNLIDRFVYGSVTDFFDLGWWPIFNIADSCISIAVVVLLYAEVQKYLKKRKASI